MTNPVDDLAGDDLLRAVAEVEGVDPSELEPWEVFKRVLELVYLKVQYITRQTHDSLSQSLGP